ncbi:MAG: nodulation protein NolW [Gammaproteobacteria bacterium]|nr:MAG: nodulation protein NolW [Gammaproteobacteria bacterium]
MPHGWKILFGVTALAALLSGPCLAQEETLEVIPLKHLTAGQAVSLVKPFVDGPGAVQGYNNRLIVRTTPENLAHIKEILAKFDVAPRSLLITVKQDVVAGGARDEAEIKGEVRSGDIRARAGKTPTDGVEVRITRSDTRLDDKNARQVKVLEGNPALIQIGQSIPVVERIVDPAGPDPKAYNTVIYKDVTTGFSVLPRVNGDSVTLEISPQRAEPDQRDGGAINIQRIHTTVSGKLGEWIDIGGAVRAQSSADSDILSSIRDLRNEQRRVLIKVEEAPANSPAPP